MILDLMRQGPSHQTVGPVQSSVQIVMSNNGEDRGRRGEVEVLMPSMATLMKVFWGLLGIALMKVG